MTGQVSQTSKRKKQKRKTKPADWKPEIRRDKPQLRACLRCAKSFKSDGPGNRICGGCKGGDGWHAPQDLSIVWPR